MLDIGWQELFVIAVVAIIFIGPKELPHVVKTGTQWLRKAREMAREFQSGLDEMAREAELEDIKKEVQKATDVDIKGEITKTIDPTGDLGKELTNVERDLNQSATILNQDPTPPAIPASAEPAPSAPPVNYDSMVERPEPKAEPKPEPAPAGGTPSPASLPGPAKSAGGTSG